jgi:hypothetical protein
MSLVPTRTFAEAASPVGSWENPRTGMVIEYSSSGEATPGRRCARLLFDVRRKRR